jgi:hypothetical protein
MVSVCIVPCLRITHFRQLLPDKPPNLGKVQWLESRATSFKTAAQSITQKLCDAGVKRGQVLSIDAHMGVGGDAVFSAFYSKQLPHQGGLKISMSEKTAGWDALYLHAAAATQTLGTSSNIISITACAELSRDTRVRGKSGVLPILFRRFDIRARLWLYLLLLRTRWQERRLARSISVQGIS